MPWLLVRIATGLENEPKRYGNFGQQLRIFNVKIHGLSKYALRRVCARGGGGGALVLFDRDAYSECKARGGVEVMVTVCCLGIVLSYGGGGGLRGWSAQQRMCPRPWPRVADAVAAPTRSPRGNIRC